MRCRRGCQVCRSSSGVHGIVTCNRIIGNLKSSVYRVLFLFLRSFVRPLDLDRSIPGHVVVHCQRNDGFCSCSNNWWICTSLYSMRPRELIRDSVYWRAINVNGNNSIDMGVIKVPKGKSPTSEFWLSFIQHCHNCRWRRGRQAVSR